MPQVYSLFYDEKERIGQLVMESVNGAQQHQMTGKADVLGVKIVLPACRCGGVYTRALLQGYSVFSSLAFPWST
jgi:hypothetical protein